ncbi:MAG: hypothetical protein RQ826_05595 [Xanthomonadales bacterium]|nr:hypothetical protein [Xanthomonadales bacterium]
MKPNDSGSTHPVKMRGLAAEILVAACSERADDPPAAATPESAELILINGGICSIDATRLVVRRSSDAHNAWANSAALDTAASFQALWACPTTGS